MSTNYHQTVLLPALVHLNTSIPPTTKKKIRETGPEQKDRQETVCFCLSVGPEWQKQIFSHSPSITSDFFSVFLSCSWSGSAQIPKTTEVAFREKSVVADLLMECPWPKRKVPFTSKDSAVHLQLLFLQVEKRNSCQFLRLSEEENTLMLPLNTMTTLLRGDFYR